MFGYLISYLTNVSSQDASSSNILSNGEVVTAAMSDGFSDLQDISGRLKAIENKVVETKKLAEERSLRALKSQNSR